VIVMMNMLFGNLSLSEEGFGHDIVKEAFKILRRQVKDNKERQYDGPKLLKKHKILSSDGRTRMSHSSAAKCCDGVKRNFNVQTTFIKKKKDNDISSPFVEDVEVNVFKQEMAGVNVGNDGKAMGKRKGKQSNMYTHVKFELRHLVKSSIVKTPCTRYSRKRRRTS